MRRVRCIHTHMPHFVIVKIKHRDRFRLLQHLHAEIPKHVGHARRPALIAGRRIADAAQRLREAADLQQRRKERVNDHAYE